MPKLIDDAAFNQVPGTSRRVIVLILPDVQLLDLAGPVQVFDTASRLGASYKLLFCAAKNEIKSAQKLYISHLTSLPEASDDDLILVPGCRGILDSFHELLDNSSKRWLKKSYKAGVQIASICTGAAVLGEAGLLDGRRCTTHWAFTSRLQKHYPTSRVLEGVLYVHDGRIISSAGVSSGIDMALWLLEQDFGPRLMSRVARQLVVYLRRNGQEKQRSVFFLYRSHLDSLVHLIQDWLIEHSTEKVSLSELSKVAQVSERSLTRSFKSAIGITPHQYQKHLRLDIARQLITKTDLTIEAVAYKSGFGDSRNLRRAWKDYYKTKISAARNSSTQI